MCTLQLHILYGLLRIIIMYVDIDRDDEIDCAVQEDNGIQYTFEVYERKLAKH